MSSAVDSDSSKLVFWALIAAVVTFVLFIALAVGSIVFQPGASGGLQYQPEMGEVEGPGGEMYVP